MLSFLQLFIKGEYKNALSFPFSSDDVFFLKGDLQIFSTPAVLFISHIHSLKYLFI